MQLKDHDELMRLMTEPQALRPEYDAHVYKNGLGGWTIQHKFYIDAFYRPGYAGLANRSIEFKTKRAAEYREKGDYYSYLFIHERPFRFEAFLEIQGVLRPAHRWKTLREVWDDSENIHQHRQAWIRAWTGPHPKLRPLVMDQKEREQLAAMPDRLTVYRGVKRASDLNGMSWTLDRGKAEWFARRRFVTSDNVGWLAIGSVRRVDVLGYFTGRGEDEIVAFPSQVKTEQKVRVNDDSSS